MRRRMLFGAVAGALVCALAATAWVAVRGGSPSRSDGPLAAVLVPGLAGSRLVVVDLASSRVLRSIHLRSLVTDIAADPGTGLVVGAQSGGVGDQADDALSLSDPRTGSVRYVGLPTPDPARVAIVGGRAVVLHSVAVPQGLCVSVVGLSSASVVATGHVPDGPGVWTATRNAVWTTALARGDGPARLLRVDPQTLAASFVSTAAPVAVEGAGDQLVGLGSDKAGPLTLLDPVGGATVATAASSLPSGPRIAAECGSRLVVGDWNGEEPESRFLESFDAVTLGQRRRLAVDGVPCAIAGWSDRVLVIDRVGGRLLQMDARTGKLLAAADLGERDLIFSDIAVVPGGALSLRAVRPR